MNQKNKFIMNKELYVLMIVFSKIQYDARVIRAAENLSKSQKLKVKVLSCNSDPNYKNEYFESISYNNTKLSRFPLMFAFWMYILYWGIKNRRYISFIYSHDYQIISITVLLSKLINKKILYDAHEILIQRKAFKISIKRYLFIFLEKIAIRHVDIYIAANKEREKIMRNIYKLRNTCYVNNIADAIAPTTIKKKNYILFQGDLADDRDLVPFIKSFSYLDESISMKIIGGGKNLNKYKQIAEQLGLADRIVFTGMLPYNQLLKESLECKIGIITYPLNNLNCYYCSPNKIFEYANFKIALLVSPQPFLKEVIERYKIGKVLNYPLIPSEISSLINEMLHTDLTQNDGFNKFLHDYDSRTNFNQLNLKISEMLVDKRK